MQQSRGELSPRGQYMSSKKQGISMDLPNRIAVANEHP